MASYALTPTAERSLRKLAGDSEYAAYREYRAQVRDYARHHPGDPVAPPVRAAD